MQCGCGKRAVGKKDGVPICRVCLAIEKRDAGKYETAGVPIPKDVNEQRRKLPKHHVIEPPIAVGDSLRVLEAKLAKLKHG